MAPQTFSLLARSDIDPHTCHDSRGRLQSHSVARLEFRSGNNGGVTTDLHRRKCSIGERFPLAVGCDDEPLIYRDTKERIYRLQ